VSKAVAIFVKKHPLDHCDSQNTVTDFLIYTVHVMAATLNINFIIIYTVVYISNLCILVFVVPEWLVCYGF